MSDVFVPYEEIFCPGLQTVLVLHVISFSSLFVNSYSSVLHRHSLHPSSKQYCPFEQILLLHLHFSEIFLDKVTILSLFDEFIKGHSVSIVRMSKFVCTSFLDAPQIPIFKDSSYLQNCPKLHNVLPH